MPDIINLIPELATEEAAPSKEAMELCNALSAVIDLPTRTTFAQAIDTLIARRVAVAIEQMFIGMNEQKNVAVRHILEHYAPLQLPHKPDQ